MVVGEGSEVVGREIVWQLEIEEDGVVDRFQIGEETYGLGEVFADGGYAVVCDIVDNVISPHGCGCFALVEFIVVILTGAFYAE